MKLDERVNKINQMIKQNSADIFSGQTPDMSVLENEINAFIEGLKPLPPKQVRDYANLVNIWAIEVKKMSEKLNHTKSQIQTELNQANRQGKATTAYATATKLSEGQK